MYKVFIYSQHFFYYLYLFLHFFLYKKWMKIVLNKLERYIICIEKGWMSKIMFVSIFLVFTNFICYKETYTLLCKYSQLYFFYLLNKVQADTMFKSFPGILCQFSIYKGQVEIMYI